MLHLIWVDVVSSISKNSGSKLLDHYRKLLLHRPIDPDNTDNQVLLEKTMGCDSTTVSGTYSEIAGADYQTLAFAEIVALSEWKTKTFDAGCLSTKDLLERARPIEQLLEEREWRESHLQSQELKDRLYSDAFFYAAKILLASTIDGPYPSCKIHHMTAVFLRKLTWVFSTRHCFACTKDARNPQTLRRDHPEFQPRSRSRLADNSGGMSRWDILRTGILQRSV